MILNTYLKANNISIQSKYKSWLGRNLNSSYKRRYNVDEVKKVSIQENGKKFFVSDYPREFFTDKKTQKIINTFLKKYIKIKPYEKL